ncbi:hypothetical protein WA171_000084 [Blastocystis sp. BT1]
MSLEKNLAMFRITIFQMYCLFFLLFLSLGTRELVPQSRIGFFVYRFFIYDELFTYVVAGYLIYAMRSLELLYGCYKTMSILFTIGISCILTKLFLSLFFSPSYAVIMYLSSEFAIYWKSIPSVPSSSYPVFSSMRISEKIANGILLLFLALSCSIRGLVEGIVGIYLGLFIHYLCTEEHILIPFPKIFTSILLKIVAALFEDRQRYRSLSVDSNTPLRFDQEWDDDTYVSDENITQLMNMGFSRVECMRALQQCDNDLNRAVERLIS